MHCKVLLCEAGEARRKKGSLQCLRKFVVQRSGNDVDLEGIVKLEKI